MLKRARENGVLKIVCIGTSHEDSLAACEFASKHDDVYWTYGVHPEGAGRGLSEPVFVGHTLRRFAKPTVPQKQVSATHPIAIGEVGLDYHHEGYNREAQIRLFKEMLQLAVDNNLPLSFHVRNAFDDFFGVVRNFPTVHGVIHSFTDSKKNLKKILETTDFYIGVNGLATYTTLPTPPLDRILLETDAPFLTPAPFRDKINEPAYIPEIAKWLSRKLEVDFKTVEETTTKNAEKLYFLC